MMLIKKQKIMKEFINIRKNWLQQNNRVILWNIRKQLIYTLKTLPVKVNKFGDQYMKLLMIHILKQ